LRRYGSYVVNLWVSEALSSMWNIDDEPSLKGGRGDVVLVILFLG